MDLNFLLPLKTFKEDKSKLCIFRLPIKCELDITDAKGVNWETSLLRTYLNKIWFPKNYPDLQNKIIPFIRDNSVEEPVSLFDLNYSKDFVSILTPAEYKEYSDILYKNHIMRDEESWLLPYMNKDDFGISVQAQHYYIHPKTTELWVYPIVRLSMKCA